VAEPRGPRSRAQLGGRRTTNDRSARSSSSLILFALVGATLVVVGSASPFQGIRTRLYDALAPVRSAGSTISEPFSNLLDSSDSRSALEQENEDLRERLVDAQSKLAVAEDAIRERRELLAMAGLEEATGLPSVAARVSVSAIDNLNVSIEISRGSNDGVKVGMPVVAGYSLVGRVTVVTPRASRVRLLTQRKAVVGIRHSSSGEVGTAVGQGPGKPLVLNLIDPTAVVRPGDELVTSGLVNARFPAGLSVGRVVSAQVEQGELQQTVTVQPIVDLDQLSLVRVLLWTPPEVVPAERVTTVAVPTTTAGPTSLPTVGSGSVDPGPSTTVAVSP
jgi:rod shape-determining protein MreC